jgi:hypothetical protein
MIFNDLLTSESLAEEYLVWCQTFRLDTHGKRVPRFGQYICNKYLIVGKSAPDIFYAENVGDAYYKIVDALVTKEV